MNNPPPDIHVVPAGALQVDDIYELLRLRCEVFYVEQRCDDLDLDRRDLEDETIHYWSADDNGVTSYLRVLSGDGSDRWIGRVCTRTDARGKGLSGNLVSRAVADHGSSRILIHAQSYLIDWYRKYGFEVSGEEFLEGGLPHREMIRQPSS